jgi:hypothetical protein
MPLAPPTLLGSSHDRALPVVSDPTSGNAARCSFDQLPNEVLHMITSYLDEATAISLCFTARRFYNDRFSRRPWINPMYMRG